MTWQGASNGTGPYAKDDAVSYGGSSYISTTDGNATTPGADPSWQLIAQIGSTESDPSDGTDGA